MTKSKFVFDEKIKITLINFIKYKLVVLTMEKIERNKIDLYLFNSVKINIINFREKHYFMSKKVREL